MSKLSYLSKKSWHTSSLKNQERVWLEEQKKAEEAKKLEELRQQILEEQEEEQLQALREQSGLVTRDAKSKAKLSWMYQAPKNDEPTEEDYLLGKAEKKLDDQEGETQVKKLEEKEAIGSLWLKEASSNENEKFRRRMEDPLFMIKQREQELVAKVMNNPLRMREARERAKSGKSDRKKKSKNKRKHKDKKRRKRDDDSSSSSSDSEGEEERKRKRKSSHKKKKSASKKRKHHKKNKKKKAESSSSSDSSASSSSSSDEKEENKDRSRKRQRHREEASTKLQPERVGVEREEEVGESLGPSKAMRDSRKEYIEERQRKSHRSYGSNNRRGNLSHEEKRRRLHEMGRDGKRNDRDQREYLQRSRDMKSKELEETKMQMRNLEQDAPEFLREHNKTALEQRMRRDR